MSENQYSNVNTSSGSLWKERPSAWGVFNTPADTAGLQEVPYVENAQTYAVTLEPRGGSETPTMEQMYVIGEI